jgi:hypothetical protein
MKFSDCCCYCYDTISHPEIENKIEDYISFYQLRSYGYLNDVPVTEQVFVHSKIMIGSYLFYILSFQ